MALPASYSVVLAIRDFRAHKWRLKSVGVVVKRALFDRISHVARAHPAPALEASNAPLARRHEPFVHKVLACQMIPSICSKEIQPHPLQFFMPIGLQRLPFFIGFPGVTLFLYLSAAGLLSVLAPFLLLPVSVISRSSIPIHTSLPIPL